MVASMLRITRQTTGGTEVVRLEGALRAEWLAETRAALTRTADDPAPLRLDLADVTFADDAGLALLREILADGAHVTRCSGYLAALLGLETL